MWGCRELGGSGGERGSGRVARGKVADVGVARWEKAVSGEAVGRCCGGGGRQRERGLWERGLWGEENNI